MLVMCTVPNRDTAEILAKALVESRLAACVAIQPPGESVYRWEGRLEKSTELTLFIKTTREGYPALEAAIVRLHPYEVPEILAFDAAGLPAYMKWVSDSVIASSPLLSDSGEE
ncbi:divalent-cation tolerance protein CutA [Paludibacterium paludis]|uniref:Divalent ion tolerance protein CutA n=2 Tax=Paludibacterium paludis TaxID=1225769 RepID=A0A918P0L3_9NEIS|nr:divalent-cation tolerance protein CutA [Paludibacterium paludis]GGY09867.1 divalent ion tolerance protein CutA [Paludibacterium paludis]